MVGLVAKGARAAVVLSGDREGEVWKEVPDAHGRNIGITLQVLARAGHGHSYCK